MRPTGFYNGCDLPDRFDVIEELWSEEDPWQIYVMYYTKTVICPDGCVIFRLTAKPLGNKNFHKGLFWEYPDQT